jgi:hypothetical protein
MEELVDLIRPLFARERMLTRWVAIRGALLFLDMSTPDDESWENLVGAMGLRRAADPFTNEMRTELLPMKDTAPPAAQEHVLGLFSSIALHVADYERVSNMSVQAVNSDADWVRVNEAVGLDYIAWVAVAMCRTNCIEPVLRMPEPGMLERSGWYTDPLFAKAERFWDGTDWTARMRVREGRRNIEVDPVPLR